MFTVEDVVCARYPGFARQHRWLRSPVLAILRLLFHESRFRQFAQDYPHLRGVDFVDQVLEYFDFSYAVRSNERERIPAAGPLLIVANHPIGSLDGLALLRLVSEIRPDVKAVANELLMAIEPLHPLLLPVDAMNGRTARDNIRRIEAHLGGGGALVIFPAGEVSRLSPRGVRDGNWRSGFLRMARRARADIVPVLVDGRNSAFFYSVSMLAKPLSTLLLIREMFRHANNSVAVRIGHAVSPAQYQGAASDDERLAARFRNQVYALAKAQRKPLFPPAAKAIAHPESRQLLRLEMRGAEALGATRDGKRIGLCRHETGSVVLREIGRLREIAFPSLGEGSGERRDVDRFDPHYEHIVLWDDNDLEDPSVPTGCARRAAPSCRELDLFVLGCTPIRCSSSRRQWRRSGPRPSNWGAASCSRATGDAADLTTWVRHRRLPAPTRPGHRATCSARSASAPTTRPSPPASCW